MGTRRHVLAIQSLGFIPDPGSVARIERAAKLVEEGKIPRNALMLWPQGFSAESPTLPTAERPKSLGEDLATLCRSILEFSGMKIVQKALSWTTRKDIQACYRMAREEGYEQPHFHFVTHPLHLWRVRIVWYMTHPKGWTADFHQAPHAISGREIVHELVGDVYYLFILLRDRLFGRIA